MFIDHDKQESPLKCEVHFNTKLLNGENIKP